MDINRKDKPKHLGRGLQSLIGPITSVVSEEKSADFQGSDIHNYPIDKELRDFLREIDVNSVSANPHQARVQ